MWKHRTHTGINLFGLTVGLTGCLIIALYVLHELSYDRFHAKADRIYRVMTESPGFGLTTSSSTALYDELKEYPDVVSATRVFRHWFHPLVSRNKEKGFVEEQFFYADSTLFEVFSFEVIAGEGREALSKPFHALLTESTAKRYFGSENPLGQTIKYNAEKEFTVAGIIRDVPQNSHFRPDFIVSLSSAPELFWPGFLRSWGQMVKTYIVVNDPSRIDALRSALTEIYRRRFGQDNATAIRLQPLTDIHLHTEAGGDFGVNNDFQYVQLLAFLGIVILALSLGNYMNLTAARGMTRAKEVGIRRAIGVQRAGLVLQFLAESILLSLIAMILAVSTTELMLPLVNDLIQIKLSLSSAPIVTLLWTLPAFTLMTGLLAGLYPALVISRFDTVQTLKGRTGEIRGGWMRKGMVVLQFSASVVLIFLTMIIYQQMRFIQGSRLGYTDDVVAVVPLKDPAVAEKVVTLKQEWQRISGVQAVAMANAMPGKGHAGDYLTREGLEKPLAVSVNWIDEGFLQVMEIPLAAGRGLSPSFPADEANSLIINAEAASQLGFTNPENAIGQTVRLTGTDNNQIRSIVGVVRDFHYESLHQKIGPLVLVPQFERCAYLMVRFKTASVTEMISSLHTVWGTIASEQPFSYFFMDENVRQWYEQDERWTSMTSLGASIATVIASLGLLGLSMVTIQRRVKEIGIRKVLGASIAGLLRLLTKEYAVLVVLAVVVAWPIGTYLAHKWLEGFAYRNPVDPWTFLGAGVMALSIALLTVIIQAYRATRTNPVEALRYE